MAERYVEPEEDESESESASSDDPKRGKPNPLKVWARSLLERTGLAQPGE